MAQRDAITAIRSIRECCRSMVRELGMLGDAHAALGITNSQVHALIELEKAGGLSVVELAQKLRLEKSSVSRLVDCMEERQWVKVVSDSKDRRKKRIQLGPLGQKKLLAVHCEADGRVERALQQLTPSEQKLVMQGLDLYAAALRRSALLKGKI